MWFYATDRSHKSIQFVIMQFSTKNYTAMVWLQSQDINFLQPNIISRWNTFVVLNHSREKFLCTKIFFLHAVYRITFISYSRLPHLYGKIRMAVMVEQLLREQKLGLNVVDWYAMVVNKESCVTVSHLPQKIAVINKVVIRVKKKYIFGCLFKIHYPDTGFKLLRIVANYFK